MSIVWQYLDKRSATINALQDYSSMEFILSHTDDEIKNTRDQMAGISSPQLDSMPRVHNPQATEERIVSGVDEIDVLKERYRQAAEYMEWFKPAWEQLSEDERYVLEAFYSKDNSYGSGTIYDIAERFHIDRNAAYKRKNRALDRLTVLLFGKP